MRLAAALLVVLAVPMRIAAQAPETAFTLPDRAFAAEGLAFSAVDGSFFLGSVHLGLIVRVDARGAAVPFAEAPGRWSVLGMAVDSARGALWAATAALPQARDADSTARGRTALVRFDLASGRVVRAYAHDGAFGDVALGPDGAVYVTDGLAGTVHVLDGHVRDADSLRVLVPRGVLHSAQGAAFGRDPHRLFVADYRYGLTAVDTRTGAVTLLPIPVAMADRRGIDGLVYADGALFAVQNGLRPARVWRLRLSDDEARVVAADVLASAEGDARFDEPTLAAVAGPWLYVVAASGWGHFSDDGALDETAAPAPLVVRVRR